MAIIFENNSMNGNLYELEKPMRNIRSCANNNMTYSYKNLDILYPDILLVNQGNKKRSLVNANHGAFHVYKSGSEAIDLNTGDLVEIMEPK